MNLYICTVINVYFSVQCHAILLPDLVVFLLHWIMPQVNEPLATLFVYADSSYCIIWGPHDRVKMAKTVLFFLTRVLLEIGIEMLFILNGS